jgi:hypothetical protein
LRNEIEQGLTVEPVQLIEHHCAAKLNARSTVEKEGMTKHE